MNIGGRATSGVQTSSRVQPKIKERAKGGEKMEQSCHFQLIKRGRKKFMTTDRRVRLGKSLSTGMTAKRNESLHEEHLKGNAGT